MTTPQPPPLLLTSSSYAIPASQQSQNLLLDSSIRDWVVLPLLLIMIIAGLLRQSMTLALKSPNVKPISHLEHRTRNAISRCSKLRMGGMAYLTERKWNARKVYWLGMDSEASTSDSPKQTEGYLQEELHWVDAEEHAREKAQEEAPVADEDIPNPMD